MLGQLVGTCIFILFIVHTTPIPYITTCLGCIIIYNTNEKPFEHEVLKQLHFHGSPCSDVLTSVIYPCHESSPLNASLATTRRSLEVFPVPHGFQCFSSGIPVESSGLPLKVHWKSTGHLNSHKPNKFIRLSSKSPLDFHWTSTGSPLDSTIFHWTFVPVLFQWTPVDSSGIPVESSGIPVEFTGICSTVFK